MKLGKHSKGLKRWLLALMILTAPMVSAQPISTWQGSFYFPRLTYAPQVSYGLASWYSETDPGINFRTANGEVFDDSQLTCASWHFPFGTYLQVQNEATGKSVVCRVNDRGPSKRLNRLIDLTQSAFRQIAPLHQGLLRVSITPIKK